MRAFLLSSCFLALVVHGAEDWPRWRGPSGDGRWNPTNLPDEFHRHEPQRLWKVSIGGGYSGVTVSDERVYLMDRPTPAAKTERILCCAAGSGKLLWQHEWPTDYRSMEYPNGPRASVTLYDGRAYALGAAAPHA